MYPDDFSSGYSLSLFSMLDYLKDPKFETNPETNFFRKVSSVIKLYFITFIFTCLSVALITIIDYLVVKVLHQNSIWDKIRNSNTKVKVMFGPYSFIIVAILIPLIEELIFRLPMNLKKWSISIAIAILYLRFSGNFITHFFDLNKREDLIKILISILIFLTLMAVLSQKKLDLIRRNHFHIFFLFYRSLLWLNSYN